ncbi:MAG: hypothetical protein AB8G95_00525 [Anaerolineae bacterium]
MSDLHTFPAIVVAAYNRPDSLERLLTSISQAQYPADAHIPLVISIDGGGENGHHVREVARNFEWEYGPKELIEHPKNLGLIEHVFTCGDLSQRFGEIILLEDDLFVGRAYYLYAQQALAFYQPDSDIAGISLSALWFHGFTQLPFTPYLDGSDCFFMQVAWYQGQAYTADQWRRFREWLAEDGSPVTESDNMHSLFSQFPNTDWFPLKTRYLVKTGRFYAFPRHSLVVNFGETGTHFAEKTTFFQVPLQEGQSKWHFQTLADATAVYDSWQEMLPSRVKRLAPTLESFDFVADFYGERDVTSVEAEYLLTTQPSIQTERSWGLTMRPPVANLVHEILGNGISLVRPDQIKHGRIARLKSNWRKTAYFNRYRPQSRWASFKLWLGRWFSRSA